MLEGIKEICAELQISRLSQLKPLGRGEIIVQQTGSRTAPVRGRSQIHRVRRSECRGVELLQGVLCPRPEIGDLAENKIWTGGLAGPSVGGAGVADVRRVAGHGGHDGRDLESIEQQFLDAG